MKKICKVLIVDDELIMRQGLKFMVDWEKEGVQIVGEASNGKDGLELVETLHPNLILCDVVMPIMDGIDFTKIVHAKYPEIGIIMLSGYDKFEYVKTAWMNGVSDYLLKPTLTPEELVQAVKNVANKIPGIHLEMREGFDYIQRFVHFLHGKEEVISIETLRNLFHYTRYRIGTIRIRHPHGKRRELTRLIYHAVSEWGEEKEEYDVICFQEEEQIIGIVVNYGMKQQEQIMEEIQELEDRIRFIDSKIFGVVSEETMDVKQLKEPYNQMIKKDIYQSFYRKEAIFQKQIEKKNQTGKRFDFYGFTNYLNTMQYESAVNMLELYIKQAMEYEIEEYYLKNQTKTLCYNLLVSMETKERAEEKRREVFSDIDQTESVHEFHSKVTQLFLEFHEMIQQKQMDEVIHSIVSYIRENYEKDLNLMEVAKVFGFNYSYLSTYFHSHKGEGFSEYVNQIRVEKACQLLEEREKTIADISELVGYRDHSYFCRVFKKITGKTPSQYRREGDRG